MFPASLIVLALAVGPFALMLYLARQKSALKPVRIKQHRRRR